MVYTYSFATRRLPLSGLFRVSHLHAGLDSDDPLLYLYLLIGSTRYISMYYTYIVLQCIHSILCIAPARWLWLGWSGRRGPRTGWQQPRASAPPQRGPKIQKGEKGRIVEHAADTQYTVTDAA